MSETNRAARSTAAVIAPPDGLKRLTKEVFVRASLSDAHAGIVADVLVWADLRGVDSHDGTRMPRYAELIEAGDLNPNPAMTVLTETAASVLIDAHRAAGPVAMTSANRLQNPHPQARPSARGTSFRTPRPRKGRGTW